MLQIFTILLLCHSFLFAIHGFAPSPAPGPDLRLSPLRQFPPSPTPSPSVGFPSDSPVPGPANPSVTGLANASSTAPDTDDGESGNFGEDEVATPSEPGAEEDDGSKTLKWCTVREEYDVCQDLVSGLDQYDGYTWKCVRRETTQECLNSIKKGEADITNLEAGLAYTAFTNYSMKAIVNEVYCQNSQTYDAVAVVSRQSCQRKNRKLINLMDFKGHKSCHGGYSTAAGWNYPINHIISESSDSSGDMIDGMNDRDFAAGFFSQVCAPSDMEGQGMCSGCGNENGSCHLDSSYFGHSGAFRCLMDELGDIAFVKADTALMYSKEGPNNQSWSMKSVRDFMYLCPRGGCQEINGYPGSCSFGRVPANVIMARNSIPNNLKSYILQTLTNASRIEVLYGGKTGVGGLFSPSTERLEEVKKLTRSYLGKSASISQSIQELKATSSPLTGVSDDGSSSSSSSCLPYDSVAISFSLVLLSLYSTILYVN